MRNVLLSDLILRSQRRCDREGDDHIVPDEWKSLISTSYAELYSLVVESGMRYFETEASITATGAASYTLPADHLATIGIDLQVSSLGDRRALRPIAAQERGWLGLTGEARRYAIIGQTIVLYPNPTSGTYKHLYVAQPPNLNTAALSSNVDVVTPDGEELVIWATAVKALAKSEADVSVAMREREEKRMAVAEWAVKRLLLDPSLRIVRDVPDMDAPEFADSPNWWYRAW